MDSNKLRIKEEAVLSAIFQNPGLFPAAKGVLWEGDFVNKNLGIIWQSMEHLFARNQPITLSGVYSQLVNWGYSNTMTEMVDMVMLAEEGQDIMNNARYVRDQAVIRGLVGLARIDPL